MGAGLMALKVGDRSDHRGPCVADPALLIIVIAAIPAARVEAERAALP
jgi:hypothetical protein